MHGFSAKEEIVGKNAFEMVAEKDRARAMQEFKRVFDGEDIGFIEYTLLTKDGKEFDVLLSNSVLRDSKGDPVGFLGGVIDITERKRIEAELKAYSDKLEHMVEERTQELKSSQDKLLRSEKLAAIGQFSAGVAHDLRNPLNIMYNVIYLLKLKLGDGDEKTNRLLSMLEAETKKSNDIIGRVMDFARTEEPQTSPIDIHKVIDAALSGILIPTNVEIVLDDSSSRADLPAALVDSAQIARVFSNVITNAIQAMPGGGKLTVNAAADADSIITAFEDTGIGIAAGNLDKIFEPLFTTKHKTGGTGIGLAASKAIVEAHKGDIEVKSREGKGTTISVKLPAKTVTQSAQ